MTVLLWWLIPLVATVLAVVFVALRSRPSKPVDAEQGMADLARFREAMSRPMPAEGHVRPRSGSFDDLADDELAHDGLAHDGQAADGLDVDRRGGADGGPGPAARRSA